MNTPLKKAGKAKCPVKGQLIGARKTKQKEAVLGVLQSEKAP